MSIALPTFTVPYFVRPRLCLHGRVKAFSVNKLPKIISYRYCLLPTKAYSDDGGQGEIFAAKVQFSASADPQTLDKNSSDVSDAYLPLFIRMLGLDNSILDREQAVIALWKYSLGGKEYVDTIMKYGGTLNLIVNLLQSDSDSACEASAGLLRVISSINSYREPVAASGAIEAITDRLERLGMPPNVKEQALCTLWNLAVDEKFGAKISRSDILPLVVKCLDDEDMNIKEAAGGLLANLALFPSNHKTIVEIGVIPKLARVLMSNEKDAKTIRKMARNTLLELAKDEYYRLLVMEEGLVVVPLVGAAAYKTLRPALYSWPSLPDGTAIEQSTPNIPSRYGASELLLGLNVGNRNVDLDESKVNAVIGRTHQQFLARIGAIEAENNNKNDGASISSQRLTLLPWIDAVARLVLILQLYDESAVSRAADSIFDASINEHMRCSFKEAGAIKHLVMLISHPNGDVQSAALRALDRLSISTNVCQTIEAEGALQPLLTLFKQSMVMASHNLRAVVLSILSRILDPNKEMKYTFSGERTGESVAKKSASVPSSKEVTTEEPDSSLQSLIDASILSCLVQILKTSPPDLQRKAASILEFIISTGTPIDNLISVGIASSIEEVFQQKCSTVLLEYDGAEIEKPEIQILKLEEAGQAVSATSHLLMKLLDHEVFRLVVNFKNLTSHLRALLQSNLPLEYKNMIAASLIKLTSESGSKFILDNPVNIEVILYETIPRLIQLLKGPSPMEVKETAVLELNRIISEGLVDSTRAVASQGGIFPLVEMLEKGSSRGVEASLGILYNLSMESENHNAIVAAGAVPVLRKIVLAERPPWTRALRLLRVLPT